MTFQTNKASDVKPEEIFFKVLLMGKPKTFKTGSCATAPAPWFADFDAGIATARNVNPNIQYGSKDWLCYRDADRAALMKGAAFTQFDKDLSEVKKIPEIKTIVIDSATFLYDIAMNKALAMNGRPGQAIPTLQDWMLQMRLCREIFQVLTAIPDKHVIVTAHVEINKDETTGKQLIMPLVSGKDSMKAPAYFDCYFASEMIHDPKTKLFKPMIRTAPTRSMDLGCRYQGLEELEEPNFTALFEKMRGLEAAVKEKNRVQSASN